MNYYGKSLIKLKEFLKERDITEKEWDEYKTGKALLTGRVIMWTYCETEDWNVFINKLKKEIKK